MSFSTKKLKIGITKAAFVSQRSVPLGWDALLGVDDVDRMLMMFRFGVEGPIPRQAAPPNGRDRPARCCGELARYGQSQAWTSIERHRTSRAFHESMSLARLPLDLIFLHDSSGVFSIKRST
jgi:hypothetical protein